jgi:formamidopyrimidine-DNA glycosylase
MIELPEAVVLSNQITEALIGKKIGDVTVLQSPHKFAWFQGDPQEYPERLKGKSITGSESHGGMVEIRLGETSLAFQDGPNLRYASEPASLPKKHQLLLEFTDSSFLCVSIRMYGGIGCFEGANWDNDYYRQAREKPSPLGKEFTRGYFQQLCATDGFEKLSAKAFLATEQRVPGLGNGVLQDILFHAGIHPRQKMGTVSRTELGGLFSSIKGTLRKMVEGGGRDTEKDLFGHPGGYKTILSRKSVDAPCPRCGDSITKATYGGGSIYFCPTCQPVE